MVVSRRRRANADLQSQPWTTNPGAVTQENFVPTLGYLSASSVAEGKRLRAS